MESHHHAHGPDHHQHLHGNGGDAAMAELLELGAEVLQPLLADVTAWIAAQAGDPAPLRILDLGAGTGAGTFALLRQFGTADVTAVDLSPELLKRLADRAAAAGTGDRVSIVEADLDADWPVTGPFDLAWASSSLHHLTDPDAVLASIRAALGPGGRFALIELDSFPRFLPADIGLGRPGLEERCHAALEAERAERLPELGSDWAARLTAAGFAIEAERNFEVDLREPLPAAAGRFALASLQRVREGLGDRLADDDLAVLATLTGDGPENITRRADLSVRTSRTGWLARRP